jgi:uncharacterized membrane protein YidH (DUF202 family)
MEQVLVMDVDLSTHTEVFSMNMEMNNAKGSEVKDEPIDIGRIQLLLAEKRTALAAIRTGIAIFTLPLSVTTVLITTSRYYNFAENLHYLIPLLILCIVLVLFGTYLVFTALLKFHKQGQQIKNIKEKSPKWQSLLFD